MDLYVILLRIVHIFSGVFWVGTAALSVFFIQPTAAALGPDAQKFMQDLSNRRRLSDFRLTVAVLNVITGILLYWRASVGLQAAWITSGPGLGFTAGALAGIAALGVRLLITQSAIVRSRALRAEIQAAGQPPTAEQVADLNQLGATASKAGRWTLVLLIVTLLFMATARYLSF
ncbi:MAG: hypothetical protein ACE5NC_06850 [Anaerolineae bacterium]